MLRRANPVSTRLVTGLRTAGRCQPLARSRTNCTTSDEGRTRDLA